MVARVFSATLVGIEAALVEVQCQVGPGLKRFTLIGLPDSVLKEAKERVRCSLESCGFSFPNSDVVISLAPAGLPKAGAAFDLAIALSVLAADGFLPIDKLSCTIVLGELALDGQLKSVHGSLAAACLCKKLSGYELITPRANAAEAALAENAIVRPAENLLEVLLHLRGEKEIPRFPATPPQLDDTPVFPTFGDVVGQHAAKRALEIAAAGGHNVLMIGPPGAGKSMLASRVPSILPPLTVAERIEVTRIYSAFNCSRSSGVQETRLVTRRPFRAPHHSASAAGLVGGGSTPLPGEISLAHHGVLFLDEFSELRREALEALREPLECGAVSITRAKLRVHFPASFILVAAMNPCPCGHRGSPGIACSCPPQALSRYAARISGPIFDRIDLQIWVPPLPVSELSAELPADPTPSMRQRIEKARDTQLQRSPRRAWLNARLSPREVKKFCTPSPAAMKLLERADQRLQLSARSYTRVLKVARTIADLENSSSVDQQHVAEALSYRLTNLQSPH